MVHRNGTYKTVAVILDVQGGGRIYYHPQHNTHNQISYNQGLI